MEHSVDVKISYITDGIAGWGDLLVRAILCNFMINLAMLMVYNGFIKEGGTKILVMVVAVFIFAFLGFEHLAKIIRRRFPAGLELIRARIARPGASTCSPT